MVKIAQKYFKKIEIPSKSSKMWQKFEHFSTLFPENFYENPISTFFYTFWIFWRNFVKVYTISLSDFFKVDITQFSLNFNNFFAFNATYLHLYLIFKNFWDSFNICFKICRIFTTFWAILNDFFIILQRIETIFLTF